MPTGVNGVAYPIFWEGSKPSKQIPTGAAIVLSSSGLPLERACFSK